MIAYYDTVPAAAVFREFDGNLYAYTDAQFACPNGNVAYIRRTGYPRMLRVDPAEVNAKNDGLARVFIGRAGAAIASTSNLPYGVEWRLKSGVQS